MCLVYREVDCAGANRAALEVLLTSRDEDRTSVLGQLDIRTPRAELNSHLRRRHVCVYACCVFM